MKGFFSKHKYDLVLMTLIVLGSGLRVFICLQHNPMNYLFSDPLRHWMNGIRFPRGGYSAASDPILYQVYMYAVERITWLNKLEVGLISAALSVLMPWPYYLAARNFGLRKTPALWVWVLIAWTPSLFTIYHYIMMETLLLAMEGLALWTTARSLRKGGSWAFIISAVSWTLACLTKPTVIPLAGVCVLWTWWKKSPPLRAVVAAAGIAAVLMLPQAIRSEVALGFVAPLGNPWLTKIQHRSGAKTIAVHFYNHPDRLFHVTAQSSDYFMGFGSPSCYIEPLWPLSHWQIRRASGESEIKFTVDSAHGARDWKITYDSLHVTAREWLLQWRENIVLFLFAPSWPETAVHEWDGWLTYVTRWMWAPLIVLILICNGREFLHHRFELIPVAVTLFTLFLLLQNVATTEGRYRKPLEPLLLLNFVWIMGRDANPGSNGGVEDRVEWLEKTGSATPEFIRPATHFSFLPDLGSAKRRGRGLILRQSREVDRSMLLAT
ncbi:MAG: phospholipid carrier-dependent glycosyltransferase [Candidatus Korobacteraceae bacterium]